MFYADDYAILTGRQTNVKSCQTEITGKFNVGHIFIGIRSRLLSACRSPVNDAAHARRKAVLFVEISRDEY